MQILAFLILVSLAVALLFLGIFLWSLRSGQYDDTYTPSVRMLFDSSEKKEKKMRADTRTKKKQ